MMYLHKRSHTFKLKAARNTRTFPLYTYFISFTCLRISCWAFATVSSSCWEIWRETDVQPAQEPTSAGTRSEAASLPPAAAPGGSRGPAAHPQSSPVRAALGFQPLVWRSPPPRRTHIFSAHRESCLTGGSAAWFQDEYDSVLQRFVSVHDLLHSQIFHPLKWKLETKAIRFI